MKKARWNDAAMEGCPGHCSFARLVLQAPYGMAWALSPTESYLCVLLSVYGVYIYLSATLHCVKGNGCFSGSARCFLALICCHWSCSVHYSFSFTCSVFCADFHLSFYLFVRWDVFFTSVLFSVALQVHIVYLGHNNGLTPSLTTRFHLQLLSRVFAE